MKAKIYTGWRFRTLFTGLAGFAICLFTGCSGDKTAPPPPAVAPSAIPETPSAVPGEPEIPTSPERVEAKKLWKIAFLETASTENNEAAFDGLHWGLKSRGLVEGVDYTVAQIAAGQPAATGYDLIVPASAADTTKVATPDGPPVVFCLPATADAEVLLKSLRAKGNGVAGAIAKGTDLYPTGRAAGELVAAIIGGAKPETLPLVSEGE